MNGSFVILQELSMTNLSGLHGLSFKKERSMSKTAVISTVVCQKSVDCSGWWKLESYQCLRGLDQPLRLSQKGEVYPLYPVFHPTSIHSGQIPDFPVGPRMGHIYKEYPWRWNWDVRSPQGRIRHSLNSTVNGKVLRVTLIVNIPFPK
jgi:hypothetical protein